MYYCQDVTYLHLVLHPEDLSHFQVMEFVIRNMIFPNK